MSNITMSARTAHLLRQRLAHIPTSPAADAQLWPLFEFAYSCGMREAEIQRFERWKEKHTRQLEELI